MTANQFGEIYAKLREVAGEEVDEANEDALKDLVVGTAEEAQGEFGIAIEEWNFFLWQYEHLLRDQHCGIFYESFTWGSPLWQFFPWQ